jgi:hypothetical protein
MRENAAGTIVGFLTDGSFASDRPATWSSATAAPTSLPLLPGTVSGWASGIDASGTIVGTLYDASDKGVAVVWRNGPVADLNALIPAGGSTKLTSADGITSQGWISGGASGSWYIVTPNPR